MTRYRRAWPALAALAGAAALLALVLARADVRAGLADFLPEGRTPAARLMMTELRDGDAAALILVGVEGAPPAELARVARSMAAALPRTGLFAQVAAGSAGLEGEEAFFFPRRYLLSPATTAAAFEVPALRADLERLLRELRGAASPLAARYGVADPVGAFPAWLQGLEGASRVRSVDGAWFAPDRDRALLLARTRAGGLDVPAQERASAAIRAAFRAADPGAARLLVAGPAQFAQDAAHAIRGDVRLVTVLSAGLVALLLVWRFRSPLAIAAIAAPVVLSVAAAVVVTEIAFGGVQALALGFGASMLGISVDYPVLMVGHRKAGEPPGATRARIGAAFRLAVATATLGLGGMLFSGFPGLAQLGLFSAAGLLAAAAATWWGMPSLIVAADIAPASAGDPRWLARVEAWRRWRAWGLVPVALALAYLLFVGPRWESDLAALSPVPAASRALDAELRGALGAAEAGQVLFVEGPDAQTVLRRQETLLPRLKALQGEGAMAGFEAAARLLPSVATQEARQAALPGAQALAVRLDAARAGLPFRPEAFRPFLDAVAATRAMAPVRPEDLAGTVLAAPLAPLLAERGGVWRGPVLLQDVRDPARLAAALADAGPGATYLDTRAELGRILAGYTARAWRWLGVGVVAILAVLAAGLRDARRVARVAGSVAAAVLCAVVLLSLLGERLSLVHVVALQLVAGVGLDYALFFARPQLDEEERARTLRTLVTCNAMTLLSFGLLLLCRTPVLHSIGAAVAVGAALAMAFAFLFAGPRRTEA
jgi:predicted exporter